MSTQPPVSVGMPVYNGTRYLPAAIDSILSQTYGDFELIISDNASTDQTQAMCEDYARRDPRVRYLRQPANVGASRNFNFVFDQATTPYFKWASANDISARDLLMRCKTLLDQKPEVAVCFGRTQAIDQNGDVTRTFDEDIHAEDARPSRRFIHLYERLLANNVSAGLFRTALLRKTRPEQVFPSADLVRLVELSLYGTFHQIPEVLFYRREAPGTASRLRSMQETMELIAPDAKGRRPWPYWQGLKGYGEAALRSPISLSEKSAICAHILKSVYWSREHYWNELRRNLWS